MASNSVTLTFVADTKSFDKGMKDVQAGAAATTKSLQATEVGVAETGAAMDKAGGHTSYAAKGFRELTASVMLVNNALPPVVGQTALLAASAGDLGRGISRVIPAVKGWASSLTLLRGAGLAAGVGLATLGLTMESKSAGSANIFEKGIKDVNYALATNVNAVGQLVPGLSKLTGWWKSSADGASKAAHGYLDAAAAAAAAADAIQRLRNQQRIQGTFGIADTNPGGDAFVDQNALDNMELDPKKLQKQYGLDSSGNPIVSTSSASKAITAEQKAANAALQKWQTTVDKARQVGQSIADALSPKLEAADTGLLLFKGPTLLEKLNKQLTDTKHLAADVAQLTKLGLSGDLVGQLVQGGLASLPAADELLAGGKASVKTANNLSSQINKTANGLATNEAVRQAKLSGDITLKVDPAANGDITKFLVTLLQKYTRTNAGGNVQLALGK